MNIAVYTNILTPYRVHFFDLIQEECARNGIGFRVYATTEIGVENHWAYNDYKREYTRLLPGKIFTFSGQRIQLNREVKYTIIEFRPDVVIMAGSYFSPTNIRLLQLQKQYSYKTLFWSESHLNEVRNYSRAKIAFREMVRKVIYPKFSGFLYAGALSLQFIMKYANGCTNLFFLPNLIEQDVFDYKKNMNKADLSYIFEKYNIDSMKYNFLCPARLNPVKGILEFINLIKDSRNKDKFSIVIAGDGVLKDAIEKSAIENAVDVRLVGFRKEAEMVELYTVSDCFLMPSLSDPNPLSCIEALWSGKPLFVSNHVGNYPEVIREDENGFVFDYGKKEQALNKIDFLVNSSEEWTMNAQAVSYQIANENYNTELVVSRLVDFCVEMSK